jgi:hypothetical protein
MPLNSANKTMKELATGQSIEFLLKHNGRGPFTFHATSLPESDASFVFVVSSAPIAANHLVQFAFASSPEGVYAITIVDAEENETYVTDDITYSATGSTHVASVLAAIEAKLGVGSVRVGFVSTGATIRVEFIGDWGNRFLTVTSEAPSVTGTNTVTTPRQGYAEMEAPYTAQAADGQSSSTNTVVQGGQKVLAFGTDSDSKNILGPRIKIACTGGRGQLEIGHGGLDWSDLKDTIPGLS